MDSSRRDFLGRIAATTAMLGALPLPLEAATRHVGTTAPSLSDDGWDVSWPDRITGKRRVVFDVPEIESGYGVWRASIWAKQYQDVLKVPTKEMAAVVVLRHNGIALAMNQDFWTAHGIGKAKGVAHPVTLEPTDRNPVLLSSTRNEVPAQFDAFALPKLIERGAIVLACDLAFQDCVALVQKSAGVGPEEARKRALAQIVPGVILQPSGVFAAIRAQEAGCIYLRAS